MQYWLHPNQTQTNVHKTDPKLPIILSLRPMPIMFIKFHHLKQNMQTKTLSTIKLKQMSEMYQWLSSE